MTSLELLTLDIVAGPAPDAARFATGFPWLDGDGAVCAHVLREPGTDWIRWPGLGLFEVTEGQSSVRVWPDAGMAGDRLRDLFARRLQHLILQARGCQSLHASGVLTGRGVAALTGVSGSGKSTLAFALHLAGFAQVADDAVVVESATRPPGVIRLPFKPQLKGVTETLRRDRMPKVAALETARVFPLGMIIVLRQAASGSAAPVVRRLDGPSACLTLLAHAHVFDPRAEASRLVTDYAAVANAVPVVEVSYRAAMNELRTLVDTCRDLFETLPHSPGVASQPVV